MPPSIAKNLRITACVGLVVMNGKTNRFVMIKNKRGWDIPGGHLEAGETPEEAFKRELYEESGCELASRPVPIAVLQSSENSETGMVVYFGECRVGEFKANSEIAGRAFVSRNKLINDYFGDKTLLIDLLKIIKS